MLVFKQLRKCTHRLTIQRSLDSEHNFANGGVRVAWSGRGFCLGGDIVEDSHVVVILAEDSPQWNSFYVPDIAVRF